MFSPSIPGILVVRQKVLAVLVIFLFLFVLNKEKKFRVDILNHDVRIAAARIQFKFREVKSHDSNCLVFLRNLLSHVPVPAKLACLLSGFSLNLPPDTKLALT